jgi:antagonist of KipI
VIRVVQPGMLTTVQDLGRYGYQKYGVIVSGAMDAFALTVANILVGNTEGTAALEITMLGPKLAFEQDALIALTGFGLTPRIGDLELPTWRPLLVRGGSVLEFRPRPSGCRMYLAVAGGIQVPRVMDSASTYLRAGIGGYQGRMLQAGDVLTAGSPSLVAEERKAELHGRLGDVPVAFPNWSVSPQLLPEYRPNPVVRVLPGNQLEAFSEEAKRRFTQERFTVTPQSDRMGYRLSGPRLELSEPLEMVSEPIASGTVQVPSDGQPIVLLADHQTTGGYPKIAQVISDDLPALAQVRVGERIGFQWVTLEEAQARLRERRRAIEELKIGLGLL